MGQEDTAIGLDEALISFEQSEVDPPGVGFSACWGCLVAGVWKLWGRLNYIAKV